MTKRKVATKKEKELIRKLAEAFVCEEISKEVVGAQDPKLGKDYLNLLRNECPDYFRLLDELRNVIPSVKKQLFKSLKEGLQRD
ncbi:hypothetical protein [Glaciecola sp. 1036]|uniref:hypothetical protein n=1 Tax=Alteromonadaceae TaxID=72275 RepID=UPI003D01FDC7